MVRRVLLIMMMWWNRQSSADFTQRKNYSAVPMHLIFSRQYRLVIRCMQRITTIFTTCSEDRINAKCYQLTDMLGSTGGKQVYYEYRESDKDITDELKTQSLI